MRYRRFFLIKYEEVIPIFKELNNNLNKQTFLDSYNKFNKLINSSKQIRLNEDCLTGFKKGNIFVDEEDYSKELEFEVLRPITARQIGCFNTCLNLLYKDYDYHKNSDRYEKDSLGELLDCVFDYGRCFQKLYISYSEYLLFSSLFNMFYCRFSDE